jgi:predicted kinase
MKVEVLIGMIASGKTTYARKRADEGALVVCHDELTQMLHGGRYKYEHGLRHTYRRMEEELVKECIITQRDVVVDRTHLTFVSRRRWVDWVTTWPQPSKLVAVTFEVETPRTHAERRMASDPRGRPFEEWLTVATHHYDQFLAEPLDWQGERFHGHVEAPPWTPSPPDDPTPQPPRS